MSLKNLFDVIDLLNQGSFGKVYIAQYISKKELVALKVEKEEIKPSQILVESKIYSLLNGYPGFAKQLMYMTIPGSRVLALELLGANLIELFVKCGQKFSLKTVLMIAIQMITRLESLHSIGFVHRDIKPQNIMIGRGENMKILYLIDFGLSIPYSKKANKRESSLPPLVNTQVTGNQLFASVGNHFNQDQTPKDDLESLGYVLVYLLNGKLPWTGIVNQNKQKIANIITNLKMTSSAYQICADAPEEFPQYLRMIKSLKPNDEPEYQKYRELFMNLFQENGFEDDGIFDWTPFYKDVEYVIKESHRKSPKRRTF